VGHPQLSIVIPAFNEATTITESICALDQALTEAGIRFEVIVVSDGSGDLTAEVARRVANPHVRVVEYERNMGKGYALRTGSRVASGDWVAWFDADLDLAPDALPHFLATAQSEGADIVIGSKRHPDSVVDYPWQRRAYSWLYQQLVRVLLALNVRDTQVGIKLFRQDALNAVLPVVLVKRYAFDLEVLAVARRFGFSSVSEQPVTLQYRFTGTGMNSGAIANALVDTFAVFYRLRLLRYYDRKRRLIRRIEACAQEAAPSVTVAISGPGKQATHEDLDHLSKCLSRQTSVISVPRDEHDAHWLHDILDRSTGDVIALLEPGMRVSEGWAAAARDLLRDPHVGVVAGPTIPRLGDGPLHDAAAILSESRFGVGAARIRSHVGALREVDDFPARNLFLRRVDLAEALEAGIAGPDELCRAVRDRTGHSVVVSPDVVALRPSVPLFGPYLAQLWRAGVDRGQRLGRRHRLRRHHLPPIILALGTAAAVPAVVLGGPVATLVLVLGAGYLAAVIVFAAVIALLHRRVRLALLCAVGAVASHLVFGFGLLVGVASRPFRRHVSRPDASVPSPSRGTD
jgi:glycosyltransferase involved in cell wall biosynthesis